MQIWRKAGQFIEFFKAANERCCEQRLRCPNFKN